MSEENQNSDLENSANRLKNLRSSVLRKLFDLEHELAISSSNKVLSFGLGNLNLPIMPKIIEEMKNILDDPITHRYSSNAGLLELREEIATKYQIDYQIDYNPNQVLVTSGSLEALFDTFLALINPGEEVLIQDPTFNPYYSNQIKLSGGTPKAVPLNAEFKLEAELLNEAITPKTKAILLNFPCNPTGSVMNSSEIRSIVEMAADNGIIVISDEAYEYITYEGHKHTCAGEFDHDNVLVVSSFSKSFCMTGLRLGFVVGPSNLLKPISLVHQINTACANTPAQMAAMIALRYPRSIRESMMNELEKRRTETIKAFTSVEGIEMNYNPLGAFYIFPNVKGTGMNGSEFSDYLLENGQIVVVPGREFGSNSEDHIRVSYGFLNQNDIKEAGTRMNTLFSNLS
jgi:aspartate/methionine/tyrosine aminotransferase